MIDDTAQLESPFGLDHVAPGGLGTAPTTVFPSRALPPREVATVPVEDPPTLVLLAAPTSPPATHDPAADAPVFVDTSGRRQRRVRRIGWLLAIPAAGYLALLVSSLLGGPTVDAPFLPSGQSSSTSSAPVAAPQSSAPPTDSGAATHSALAAAGTPRPSDTTAHPAGQATASAAPRPAPTTTAPTAPAATTSAPTTPPNPKPSPSHHKG